MTEEQKDILISRMLESPAELSDDEITQILADDELRDIYSISVDIKAAKGQKSELDPALEWEIFRPRIPRVKRWYHSWYGRTAAIFAGVLFLSGILNTLINYVMDTANKHMEEKTALIEQSTNQIINSIDSIDHLYHDEERSDLVSVVASDKVKRFCDDNNKQTKKQKQVKQPKQSPTVDVEEYVRIQQARMDNDLAMQQAEAMVNQYYAMADINEAMQSSSLGDGYPMDDEILTLIIP